MTATSKRRWFQFSLGRMLLVLTMLCVGPGGYVAYQQQEARRQDAAVALLNKRQGTQAYTRPHWLRKWIDGPAAGYVVGLAMLSRQATDAELEPVAALSELVWLDINDMQAGDASLAHLAGLKKLERLRLDDSRVTDAGMVHLSGLPKLLSCNASRAILVSPSVSSSSRYANNPASVVIWLPRNFSFKRRSKPTRKPSSWQSPIGFPCQLGMIWQNTLVFKGLAQILCQNAGSQMGNAG